MFKAFCCALLTTLLASSIPAYATSAPANSPLTQAIEQAAIDYVQQHNPWPQARVSVRLLPLDPRLTLKPCTLPVVAELSPGAKLSANTSLQVSCPDTDGWRLFTRIGIEAMAPVMVAAQPLSPNQYISSNDVRYVSHDLAKLPYGFYESLPSAPGIRIKTSAAAGQIITPLMTTLMHAVRKGDAVKIWLRNGKVSIVLTGTALANGQVGDRVMVKNRQSGRDIQGRVVGPNEVEVE